MEEYIFRNCCTQCVGDPGVGDEVSFSQFIACFRLTWKPSLRFDFAVITLHKVADYNLQLTPKTILFSRSHCNSWHGRSYGKLGTSDVSWVRCTLWLEHRKRRWQETSDDDRWSWACAPGKIKFNVMQPPPMQPAISFPGPTCLLVSTKTRNQFDSKAGTTAGAIETLMGQYFD